MLLINHKSFKIYKTNFIVLTLGFLYTIFMVNQKLSILTDKNVIGNTKPKGFVPFRIPTLPVDILIKKLIFFSLHSLPLLALLLLIYSLLKNYTKEKKITAIYFTPIIFVFSFFFLDIQWNLIHNFLALYISPFIILLLFKLYPQIKIHKSLFALQFILFFIVAYNEFTNDLTSSNRLGNNPEILSIPTDKSINELTDNEIPTGWNRGQLLYIKSILIKDLNK